MGWLNLTMANQTVKNDLKAKKITLPEIFILQNFKKILRAAPELWCAIFGSRMAICPEKSFLSTNHCYYFHLPIGPFHCANFKKILPVDPKLCGCALFGPKMAHFRKWEFFLKTCYWALFLSFIPIYMPKIKARY